VASTGGGEAVNWRLPVLWTLFCAFLGIALWSMRGYRAPLFSWSWNQYDWHWPLWPAISSAVLLVCWAAALRVYFREAR
jgi:hypothetical protein